MTPNDALQAKILARIAAEPARTRAQGQRRARLIYLGSVVSMLVMFEIAGGFGHSTSRPRSLTAWLLLGTIVVAVVGTWGALGRGRSMTGRARVPLVLASLFVPVASFFWLTAWHGTYPDPASKFGWRCLALTLAMGTSLLAAVIAVRKSAIPIHPALHGAAAGAAAGACAEILVDAWCPLTDVPHVAQGHIAPIIVLTIMGALAGRVMLGLRPR